MSPTALTSIQQSALIVASPPPAVSQDLWTETADRKTRTALRAVSDDILSRASAAIKIGLPRKIVELTEIISRASCDETSIFHAKWDTHWSRQMSCQMPSPTASMASFSVIGMSTTSPATAAVGNEIVNPRGGGTATTTRRFSISQQCGPSELSFSPSLSVNRPPTHILQLWEVLGGHSRQIIEFLDLVQMYLILKTPVAEEGNNTGVEIQQQCARTLVDARRFVVGCESYLKLYHTQRAKLASKCLKYPQLEDYQRALVERDHEECKDCRYLLIRLRTQCLAVVDVLHKNFEKVDDPKGLSRGGGTVGMY